MSDPRRTSRFQRHRALVVVIVLAVVLGAAIGLLVQRSGDDDPAAGSDDEAGFERPDEWPTAQPSDAEQTLEVVGPAELDRLASDVAATVDGDHVVCDALVELLDHLDPAALATLAAQATDPVVADLVLNLRSTLVDAGAACGEGGADTDLADALDVLSQGLSFRLGELTEAAT